MGMVWYCGMAASRCLAFWRIIMASAALIFLESSLSHGPVWIFIFRGALFGVAVAITTRLRLGS